MFDIFGELLFIGFYIHVLITVVLRFVPGFFSLTFSFGGFVRPKRPYY